MDLKKTIKSGKVEFSVTPIMKSRRTNLSTSSQFPVKILPVVKWLDWVDQRVNLLVIWEKTETSLFYLNCGVWEEGRGPRMNSLIGVFTCCASNGIQSLICSWRGREIMQCQNFCLVLKFLLFGTTVWGRQTES